MLLFSFCSLLFADLSREDFFVLIEGRKIHLGDNFAKGIEIFGKTNYEVRSYPSITLREYTYEDISFFTSRRYKEDTEESSMIFGINFTSGKYSVIKNLTVGDSLADVILRLGQPTKIRKGVFYYYNHDYDVLMLKIMFDSDEKIKSIKIFMGT